MEKMLDFASHVEFLVVPHAMTKTFVVTGFSNWKIALEGDRGL